MDILAFLLFLNLARKNTVLDYMKTQGHSGHDHMPRQNGEMRSTSHASISNVSSLKMDREYNLDLLRWKSELAEFVGRLKIIDDEKIAVLLLGAHVNKWNAINLSVRSAYNDFDRHEIKSLDDTFNLSVAIEVKLKFLSNDNNFVKTSGDMIWLHPSRGLTDARLLPAVRAMWLQLERGRNITAVTKSQVEILFNEKVEDFLIEEARERYLSKVFELNSVDEKPNFSPIVDKSLPRNEDILNFSDLIVEPLLMQSSLMTGVKSEKFKRSSFSIGFITGWIVQFLFNLEAKYQVDYFVLSRTRKQCFRILFPKDYSEIEAKMTENFATESFKDGLSLGENSALWVSLNSEESKQYQFSWFEEFCKVDDSRTSGNTISKAKGTPNKSEYLTTRETGGSVTATVAGQRLTSRTNEDALTAIAAPQPNLSHVMQRLGDYELCEEDYWQLHIWARYFTEVGDPITVLELVNNLAKNSVNNLPWIESGRIKITNFAFLSDAYIVKRLDLTNVPALALLGCNNTYLTELDLSNVPKLTFLSCVENQLAELDLSNVPNLTDLWCADNWLTELNLASLPKMTQLCCDRNRLTELDLTNVPDLSLLSCLNNQLTKLDLKNLPKLTLFWCSNNQLTEIDVSKSPAITELWCGDNQLTELTMATLPELACLWCKGNRLAELELKNVPKLVQLICGDNQLTKLDLTNLPALTELHCEDNQLTELDIRRCHSLTSLHCDETVNIVKNFNKHVNVVQF